MKKRLMSLLLALCTVLSCVATVPVAATQPSLDEVVFVLGSYCVASVDDYGNDMTRYYAQGVDMEGKEVSRLIGIGYAADDLEDLGVTGLTAGYYTFALSAHKDEKKADIMTAQALDTAFDPEASELYVGVVEDRDFDSRTTSVRTEAGELAFLTDETRFVLVEGCAGEKLETAVYTGSIRMDAVTAPTVLWQDTQGNVMVAAMVIGVDTLSMPAEDVIHVSDAQLNTAAYIGNGQMEYSVYFTGANAVKEIVVEVEITAAGFYTYGYDAAENVYELTAVAEDNVTMYVDEVFRSLYNGYVVSTNIEALNASGAAIRDARADKVIAASGIPAITSLEDMRAAAQADCEVVFSALADEDENITNIIITRVNGDGTGGTAIPAPGTGILPAGPGRPANIDRVLAVESGRSVTLETLGLLSNAPDSDLVDEYPDIAVGDWVAVSRQGDRYVLTMAKTVEGVITENQASGQDCTVVAGFGRNGGAGVFDVDTDLDMIGRYVRVYYESEYISQTKPGLTYGVEDLGTTIRVNDPEVNTKMEFSSIFPEVYRCREDGVVFDGTFLHDPDRSFDEVYAPDIWTAARGTYVIFDGQIVAYMAPADLTVSKVLKVTTTTGNESVTLAAPYGVLSNTEYDDVVREYEGIAKGDIVVVTNVQNCVYRVEKAESVTGTITRVSTDEYDHTVITVAGMQYTEAGLDTGAAGLFTDSGRLNFDITYEVFTYGDTYLGWMGHSRPVQMSDVVYVLGTYGVAGVDDYGNGMTHYYAQGVDMEGREVSHLIGVEYAAGRMWDLGITELASGYYTFRQSNDKNEAEMGIAAAEELSYYYDEEVPNPYVGAVSGVDLDSETFYMRTEAGELAFLTDETRFILVEGCMGEELDAAVLTGSVRMDGVDAPVILSQDARGNVTVEAMVIGVDTLYLRAEDYIHVSDAQLNTATSIGDFRYEYEVYFTGDNCVRPIVLDYPLDHSGFYNYSHDAEAQIYELEEARDDALVYTGQQFVSLYSGKALVSTDIQGCNAANAAVVDTRTQRQMQSSGLAELTELADLTDAKAAGWIVYFDALLDQDDQVTHILIVSVEESEDGVTGAVVTPAPGTGVLPAAPGMPNSFTKVTAIEPGVSITLEREGLLSNVPGSDVVDEYMGIAVGDYVTVSRQGDRYVLDPAEVLVCEGIVTGNRACGYDYTEVAAFGGYGIFGVDTGLDMIGRYVRVYYAEEYRNGEAPGLVYGYEDVGTTVRVTEAIDSVAMYRAVFGKSYPVAHQLYLFDGRCNCYYEEGGGIPGYLSGSAAPAGTYVICDGQIVAYMAPADLTVSKVLKVTTTSGNESVTLAAPYGVLSNTANEDEIVEYPGIAAGDVVVVTNVQDCVYRVEKAESVTGTITRMNTDEYGCTVITVAGMQYTEAGLDTGAAGLSTNRGSIDFSSTYEVFTYGDTYLGWRENRVPTPLTDVIFVLGSYCVAGMDDYGNDKTRYYAQGIDMQGSEVSTLVGYEYSEYGQLTLLGVDTLEVGYYTFAPSTDRDAQKAGVMTAEALTAAFDGEHPDLYVGTVEDRDFDSRTTSVRTDSGELAFVTGATRFILVEGGVGRKLETALHTGTIRMDMVKAPVILSQDAQGNVILEAMVIGVDTLSIPAEDYVFVSEAQIENEASLGGGLYEYEVWFAADGAVRTVVVEEWIDEAGFYCYAHDAAEDIYELSVADEDNTVIFADEVFQSLFNGSIVSTNIEAFHAAGAKVYDARAEKDIAAGDIPAIESVEDMVDATLADFEVVFSALVDENENVTGIVVTEVNELTEGGRPQHPGTPNATDLNDVVFVLGSYSVVSVDTYGNDMTHYYAQGVDMAGKELSYLIGTADALGELGVMTLAPGYYTFAPCVDQDGAEAGIMAAQALAAQFDIGIPDLYVGSVEDRDFDSRTTNVRTDSGELAFVTGTTRFILVEGGVGRKLKTALHTGTIRMDMVTAPVVLGQDKYGNVTLEAAVIKVDSLGVMAEDYIYVSWEQIDNAANIGGGRMEYQAWFAGDGAVRTVVVEDWINEAGIYCYAYDAAEDVYELSEADEDNCVVYVDEEFLSLFNGYIVSTNIEAFHAAGAKLYDARDEQAIEFSDVPVITSLETMADVTLAGYIVTFSALVDEDESITNIIITDVAEDLEGGGTGILPDGPEAPGYQPEPGSGVLPVICGRPAGLAQVTRLGVENITLDTLGVLDRSVLDGHLPEKVGEWVRVEQQGTRYMLYAADGMKIFEGIITANQACGYDYTEVAGFGGNGGTGVFDVDTDLDMIGRYVRVYYESEFTTLTEPGYTYGIEELGTTIRVNDPEVDSKAEFSAIFPGDYRAMEDGMVFDGEFRCDTDRSITEVYDSDRWTTAPGTYTVYDGVVVAYVEPALLRAARVLQVDSNSITLSAPFGVLSNTMYDDVVREYEGIAKGDIVVVTNVQNCVYRVEKAESVTGTITRVSTDEYDRTVITVAGMQYTEAGLDTGAAGLFTDSGRLNFDITYEVFTYGDTYLGWKVIPTESDLSDVVYVLGVYEERISDTYGNDVSVFYAQGVDMQGTAVVHKIGVDCGPDELEDLGVIDCDSMPVGFYTFGLSVHKDEAKAGIMAAQAVNAAYDENGPFLYAGAVENKDFDSKTTGATTAAGELAFLTDETRFVLVKGSLGEKLETAVHTGSIFMDGVTAPVLLTRDEQGSVILKAVVIGVDSLAIPAEDFIHVSEAQLSTAANIGNGQMEYSVYFTGANAVKEIVVEAEITAAGFYTYGYDAAENVYELTAVAEDNVTVYMDEVFQSLYNGNIISTNIEAFKASEAKIYDARAAKDIVASGIPAIDSLEDMADATLAEYVVTFSALVDEDENVITIIVTEVVECSELYEIVVVNPGDGGTVSAPNMAEAGQAITITAAPAEGYKLDKIYVNGTAIVGNTFTMPDGNVTITAGFVAIPYSITIGQMSDGAVTVDKATAEVGQTVTVTATPAEGYVLKAILVNGTVIEGKTFPMPARNVTVTAEFVKTEKPEPDGHVIFQDDFSGYGDGTFNATIAKAHGYEGFGSGTFTMSVEDEMLKCTTGRCYLQTSSSIPTTGTYAFSFDLKRIGTVTGAILRLGSKEGTSGASTYAGGNLRLCVESSIATTGASAIYLQDQVAGKKYFLTTSNGFVNTYNAATCVTMPLDEWWTLEAEVDTAGSITISAGKVGGAIYSATYNVGSAVVNVGKNGCGLLDMNTNSGKGVHYIDNIRIASLGVHGVRVGEVTNGTVTVDKATAEAGETVTVTATPAEGYRLEKIYVDGTAIEGNTFTMPAKAVTVTAQFVKNMDYIYVSRTQLLFVSNIGNGQLEYSVYFTNEGVIKEIVVETRIDTAGFYTYTFDAAENVYELSEVDEDNTVVYVDEVFQSLYNGSIISTNIEAFEASGAKIYDARAEEDLAVSDIPAIKFLEDMADAILADYYVIFSALVDEDEKVAAIIVTEVGEHNDLYEIVVVNPGNGGTLSAPDVAEDGESIIIIATPADGYMLDKIYVDGVAIEGNIFTMPAKSVTVTAQFVKSVDYIHVSEAQLDTVANIGNGQMEYTVYFTGIHAVKEIVVEGEIPAAGFYTYTFDAAENVYMLTAAAVDNVTVYVGEVFQSLYNGSIVSTHIEAFKASGAKIFDARAGKDIAASDIPAIETLEDMVDATLAEYVVTFSALVDEAEKVTHIIVTDVAEAKTEYRITAVQPANGTLSVDRTSACAGDLITVTATPAAGYRFMGITVDGVSVAGSAFTVTGDHRVSAVFKPLLQFAGASVSLNESLDLNFRIEKGNVDFAGGYAILTAPDGKQTRVEREDWVVSGTRYNITYSLAAKQMTDEISVVIYDDNDRVMSAAYTDSIRGYATRGLAASANNVKLRTLLANMLEYGAKAQQYFKYNQNDLANSRMTEEQRSWITLDTKAVTNYQQKSNSANGATVELESRIFINFTFLKSEVTKDMTARITYTTYKGVPVTVEVAGSDFVDKGSKWGVNLDRLVFGDARELVLCEILDAQGNVVAWSRDSIESYCARALSSSVAANFLWLKDMMDFCDSAYNYFT